VGCVFTPPPAPRYSTSCSYPCPAQAAFSCALLGRRLPALPCLLHHPCPHPLPFPPPLCLQVSKRLCRQLALGNLEGVTTLALSGCDTSAPGASMGKETILEAVESIGGGGGACRL
jgi:hypothetical protein